MQDKLLELELWQLILAARADRFLLGWKAKHQFGLALVRCDLLLRKVGSHLKFKFKIISFELPLINNRAAEGRRVMLLDIVA